ncbi:MAG TPA: alpha/beta fold hydrolase, partial [Xanthobacteraceae bacterium]
MSLNTSLPPIPLADGIRSRFVDGINGLTMHVLEAGYESKGRPCILLLHGFPELAYSWRKVMPALAAAGYHVIAPDQRGYGRTTGSDANYDGDLHPFRLMNLVRDALGLVFAFGYRSVDAVVGHDFGAIVAPWCALSRPDVFRSVVLMSAPFAGPPPLPFDTVDKPAAKSDDPVHRDLANLTRPRKHYQWYYATREADADMHGAPQGLHDFLRAYYHHKSADWKDNAPFPLQAWNATELAKLPTYYVMDRDKTMAQTVAEEMPTAEHIAANRWLPDSELAFYSGEYRRTGFQGGLQWYRCGTSGVNTPDLEMFSGRTIDVPSCFIAGRQDWGIYQRPGAIEAMQSSACSNMLGCHLIEG